MGLSALLVPLGIGMCALAEAPPKAPTVPIAGTVLGADRRPAAGAGVSFSTREAGTFWGGVVARAEADDRGRFRLEVPGAPGGGPMPGILWAYRPGALVATRSISRETLPPDLPVTLVIDEPARSEFLVRGPDGRPAAGARIQPRVLTRDHHAVPDGLAERIADHTITDARGRAILSAFFPEEISTVIVAAPGLGRQQFGFGVRGGQQGVKTIDLVPAGRVEGRIVADEAQGPRPRRIQVYSYGAKPPPPVLGVYLVDVDDRGRFAVPEIPAGGLGVFAGPTAGSPWFFRAPEGLKIEPGQTTRVDVAAVKGVRLEGVVRERTTGHPLAGIAVGLRSGLYEPDARASTDTRGRFELFSMPGYRTLVIGPVPEGFATPLLGTHSQNVHQGPAEVEMAPVLLNRARVVRGIVVDDRGEPVPGATIQAEWLVNEGPDISYRNRKPAISGPRGEFLIAGVAVEASVRLSAAAPDGRRTARAAGSQAGAEPVKLVLRPSEAASLAGRVVDATGRRIAGARVHLRTESHDSIGRVTGDTLVEIRGAYTIRTADNGWFRTPPILDPNLRYAALVEADGYEPARTPWTAGGARTFPEVVLRPRAAPAARGQITRTDVNSPSSGDLR